MSLRATICNRISMICRERNITSYQIAKETNLSQTTVNGIMKEDGPSPRLDTLEKTMDFLGMDLQDLIETQNYKTKGKAPDYVVYELNRVWTESDDNTKKIIINFLNSFHNI